MKSICIIGTMVAIAYVLAASMGCATTGRKSMMTQGTVAEGYEEVREEFERNLKQRGELGGAFAAYVDGVKVVDLWGGYTSISKDKPWEQDTMVCVYSATKGLAAMALAHLHSRGLLDYDAPVARYWPGFAAKGKETVTVRQLISHQAGLVILSRDPDPADIEGMAAIIADTEPLWTPGDYQGYHAGTVGFCMQVLVHKIDPAHRTIGTYLREEISGKLDADFHIGYPDGAPMERIALMRGFKPVEAIFNIGSVPKGLRKVLFDSKSLFWKSMGNNKIDVNDPAYLSSENPSGSGVGNARGMAAMYGALAAGGSSIGISEETLDLLFGPPESPRMGRLDRVMNMEASFGLGFQKPDADGDWFSPSPRAIGFMGASGSLAFADPDRRLGAAYVTNKMSAGNQINDPRERALRKALYRSIDVLAAKNAPTHAEGGSF